MIQVTVGSNLKQEVKLYPEDTTINEILESSRIPTNRTVHLDGSPVMDKAKTLADLGVTQSCFIIAVAKADNA